MNRNPCRLRESGGLGRIDVAMLLLLSALCLAFFWKIVLTNKVLAGLDVFGYFYPYRDLVSTALRAGRLPLWNPHLFMGAPLLANSQAAVLYPLHWPLILLSAPKQVAFSILLHIWLAAAGTYLFARVALHISPWASLLAAILFALGGFLGAQVEHLNQLNASVWLPWLLVCVELARQSGSGRWIALLCGGGVVGLSLLAGHTQAAYIVLFGTLAYTLFGALQSPRERRWQSALTGLSVVAAMGVIGVLLSAAQLVPTWELSRLSVRGRGLPYNEAASFSLSPLAIFKAFLPPLVWEPPFSEYVAYVGVLGLALAAIGVWVVLQQKRLRADQYLAVAAPAGTTLLFLAALGVFLAFGAYNPIYYLLYKLVPGFALFRAPARWLLLYSFGMAMLAGIGLQSLSMLRWTRGCDSVSRSRPLGSPVRLGGIALKKLCPLPSWARAMVILALVILELFLAAQTLAYNVPTAPTAFESMRTALSHLLADEAGSSFRFLSMSDIRYDPGDMADLQAMYDTQLSDEAIYDLIVASKMKEVLAYNLPMRYRLSSVDGYDGGLLPTSDYVALERLFLGEDEIWLDGRLRQQLREIPPSQLLSLLNVKYVITDKTQDVWIDGLFYDLEHTVALGEVTLTDLPKFETTQLGVVSYLTGTTALVDNTPVAQVTVTDTAGSRVTETLLAGEHTAEGLYGGQLVSHDQARIGHRWRDNDEGSDYVTILELGRVLQPAAITVRSLLPEGQFQLRGMSLIHDPSGTSRSLTINPDYSLVHSGDVKIYENRTVLPRAYIVHRAIIAADTEGALATLRDPAFDPSQEVVLSNDPIHAPGRGQSSVQILTYDPEKVELSVQLDLPGYLVVADTFYPGWTAQVDGRAAPILRANLYFRAVPLGAGHHRVLLRYQPTTFRLGSALSLVAWPLWLLAVAILTLRIGRKSSTAV